MRPERLPRAAPARRARPRPRRLPARAAGLREVLLLGSARRAGLGPRGAAGSTAAPGGRAGAEAGPGFRRAGRV